MVLRALPHAASTIAIGPDGDGTFLSPGCTSTMVRADSERLRPLIHQLSVITIPGTMPAVFAGVPAASPNSGE
jgi:hypothetical protein